MGQPFENVRILDFTRFVAGPFGTYQLALLGADVIKIEPPGGEETRLTPTGEEWVKRKLSPSWLGLNADKRSIVLDLRQPQAIEIIKRLVPTADVVWENFRPGVMDRLGIGYETLAAINPLLIYAAVSGFGRSGPERGTAAFDGKIQALSGIMSITGHEETGPTRVGFAASDIIAGMTAAFAVASAPISARIPGRASLSMWRCWTRASASWRSKWRNTRWAASATASPATRRSAASRPATCSRHATAGCCSPW